MASVWSTGRTHCKMPMMFITSGVWRQARTWRKATTLALSCSLAVTCIVQAQPCESRAFSRRKQPPTPTRERERERELLFKRETEHLWLRQLIHGRDDNTSVDYRRRRRASACSVVEQGPLRSTKALSDVAPSSPHPPAREECETQEKLNP